MPDFMYTLEAYFKRDPWFWLILRRIGIVAAIIATSIYFIPPVEAKSSAYCQTQSNIAFEMADARDGGIPMRAFMSRSERVSPEQLHSYLMIVKMVYSNAQVFPERLGSIVFNLCKDNG